MLSPIRPHDAFKDTAKDWADEMRRSWHVGDFRGWKDHDCYQTAVVGLLRDLAESKWYRALVYQRIAA